MRGAYLPPGRDVDVGVLAALFDNTSSSYKYLYFLALLDLVLAADGQPEPLSFTEAEVGYRALALAWFPNVKHRLGFGKQDRVQRMLDGAARRLGAGAPRLDLATVQARLEEVVDHAEFERFLSQVPQRLIRPFLQKELEGVPDSRIDGTIPRVSEAAFETAVPLYRLVGARLEVHPRWRRYLTTHGAVVRGWALWHWAEYMERRNPTHYGVHRKLFPPPGRAALAEQRRYWRKVLAIDPLPCPYSGERLDGFALDHILPWSFQPNDRLWVLVPTTPAVNSHKGDRLPDLGRYVPRLAETQARGLVAARSFAGDAFARLAESFGADLGVDDDLLAGAPARRLGQALEDAYGRELRPLVRIAANQGFETGWRWAEAA